MKASRIVANLAVLAAAAGAAFYAGWMQFAVRPGQFGIMTSKTGGLYPEPVRPGVFLWRWERLLPTNVTLLVFEERPFESRVVVEGELPSADIYSRQVAGDGVAPDFSYRVEASVSLSVAPEEVLRLVGAGLVGSQEELDGWLGRKARLAAQSAASYLVEGRGGTVRPLTLDGAQLAEAARGAGEDFAGVELVAVDVASARLPDMGLYAQAEESYRRFRAEMDAALAARARALAAATADEDRAMERLERFAQMLEKYPQLNELSQGNNLGQTMELLQLLRDERKE